MLASEQSNGIDQSLHVAQCPSDCCTPSNHSGKNNESDVGVVGGQVAAQRPVNDADVDQCHQYYDANDAPPIAIESEALDIDDLQDEKSSRQDQSDKAHDRADKLSKYGRARKTGNQARNGEGMKHQHRHPHQAGECRSRMGDTATPNDTKPPETGMFRFRQGATPC